MLISFRLGEWVSSALVKWRIVQYNRVIICHWVQKILYRTTLDMHFVIGLLNDWKCTWNDVIRIFESTVWLDITSGRFGKYPPWHEITTTLQPTKLKHNYEENYRLYNKSKESLLYIVNMEHKAPVTPGLRPGYYLPATEKCRNRGQIVERMYDWSQRSWVIASAKSVAARSYVMFKPSQTGLTTRLRRSCDQQIWYRK